MYTPPHHREDRLEVLQMLMHRWSFATLVTAGDDGLVATHLPVLLTEENNNKGVLLTHLSRNNAQAKHFEQGCQVLTIFQGPHAFISPNWYENQITFPTWNYTAIHAYGTPHLIKEPDEILKVLKKTIAKFDTPLQGDWRFEDMPETEIAPRLKAIAGVRIPIDHLEGKMKLSQEKTPMDREKVVSILEKETDTRKHELAQLMSSEDLSRLG